MKGLRMALGAVLIVASVGACDASEPSAAVRDEVVRAERPPAEQIEEEPPEPVQIEEEPPPPEPEASEPTVIPLAERTPPKLARKKHYAAMWLGSWTFTPRMGSWLSKGGLKYAPEGDCPKEVEDISLSVLGKWRETERSWSTWESFHGLTGPDNEAWFEALREAREHEQDLIIVMFGGELDDMQTPAGETVSLADDAGRWIAEYERRLAEFIALLEPSKQRVLWLGMPDPAATGEVERPWARIRDAQLRALEASGEPVEYVDMTPFMVDARRQIPKRATVARKRAIIRLDSEGNFRLSGAGVQWMIQRMTDAVLDTIPIRKRLRERCSEGEGEGEGHGAPAMPKTPAPA